MIFYHLYAVGVNYCHNIALEIVDIEVVRAIEADHRRLTLRIIEEVQTVVALCHVDNILAIQRVVGGCTVYDLPDAQAVMIIDELRIGAGLHHAGEHTSGFPRKRPTVIGQRIANRIIGNRLAADGRNLIFPVRIPIDVTNGLRCRAQRTRGIGISLNS